MVTRDSWQSCMICRGSGWRDQTSISIQHPSSRVQIIILNYYFRLVLLASLFFGLLHYSLLVECLNEYTGIFFLEYIWTKPKKGLGGSILWLLWDGYFHPWVGSRPPKKILKKSSNWGSLGVKSTPNDPRGILRVLRYTETKSQERWNYTFEGINFKK